MFFETLRNRDSIKTTATFEEALTFARNVIARAASSATLRIEENCLSLYSDGPNHLLTLDCPVVILSRDDRYWKNIGEISYEDSAFDLGTDCPVDNANLHIYLRFDSPVIKRRHKPQFDEIADEIFGVLNPVCPIKVDLYIDREHLSTIIEPWTETRILKPNGDPKLHLVSEILMSSTLFELGIDDFKKSIATKDIQMITGKEWTLTSFKAGPTQRDYKMHTNFRSDGLNLAIAAGTSYSIGFIPAMKLMQSILARVMTIVAAHWPDKQVRWTAGIFTEIVLESKPGPVSHEQKLCFDDSVYSEKDADLYGPPEVSAADEAPLIDVGRTHDQISRYIVFGINVHHFSVKQDPFCFQFTLLDAVVTAVDSTLKINNRSALGAMAFNMGPIRQIVFDEDLEEKNEEEIREIARLLASPPPPPPPKVRVPQMKMDTSKNRPPSMRPDVRGHSTVMIAWNMIVDDDEFPAVKELGAFEKNTKLKKLKSLSSKMRGNRFAKPLEGSASRGGNNRDANEKKNHVLRELKDAALCGINKDEFYNLMMECGVLYTKTARREECEGQND